MKRFFFLFILSFFIAVPAHGATLSAYTKILRPGDAFIAGFSEKPQAVFLGATELTPFPYQDSWRVVLPLSLTAKTGRIALVAAFPSGFAFEIVTITPREQNVIVLPVPEKMNQTPTQLVQNLATTNTSIKSIVAGAPTKETLFNSPFGLPLFNNQKISSPFGEVRQTGEERITHLGVDFDQPKGSSVVAINSGVVAKAYLDSVYGNSVFIDHGQGIFTLYLHLDTIRVKAGQNVLKGTVVGTLGESGLASAPHLHLSIKINGSSVDPLQFVQSFR